MDPVKVEVVLRWDQPTTIMEIQSFLGLAAYYRKFKKGFSFLVAFLTWLTRKEEQFVWIDACDKSFQTLKKRLTPTLGLPNAMTTL